MFTLQYPASIRKTGGSTQVLNRVEIMHTGLPLLVKSMKSRYAIFTVSVLFKTQQANKWHDWLISKYLQTWIWPQYHTHSHIWSVLRIIKGHYSCVCTKYQSICYRPLIIIFGKEAKSMYFIPSVIKALWDMSEARVYSFEAKIKTVKNECRTKAPPDESHGGGLGGFMEVCRMVN